MEQVITIQGLSEVVRLLDGCKNKMPRAVNWALARSADDVRDAARANVSGSQYNLNSQSWKIRAKMSKRYPFLSEVGYFIVPADDDGRKVYWHIKFFERGARRKKYGRIMGQHFLQNAGQSAERIATNKMNKSIENVIKGLGLN